MHNKGIHSRNGSEVLVLQPIDDAPNGFFKSSARFQPVEGQEVWVDGIDPDFIATLKEHPELATERGMVTENPTGHINVGDRYDIFLGTKRDALTQDAFLLKTNVIREHGPSIEVLAKMATTGSTQVA